MKTYDFNEFLNRNRIDLFTLNDAVRILGKPRHYASVFLYRNKFIRKAQKGVYYTKNATSYEVASNILNPSYISLVSALRFHNLTEQIPHILYVLSPKRHLNIKGLDGYEVRFITVKKKLMFGYYKIDGAFIAEPEKAAVDMLYLKMFTEYAEEAVESGRLDVKKFLAYAEKTGVKTVLRSAEKIVNLKNGDANA
jgi:predicted transcriptional regulator of viral defense system